MKLKKALFLLCAANAWTPGVIRAQDVTYDVRGAFDSSTALTSLAGPDAAFDLRFTLAQRPTPSTSFQGYFTAVPSGLTYSLDGTSVALSTDFVTFYTKANGGLLSVDLTSGTHSAGLVFSGPQLFSGTTAAPVLSVGNFSADATSFATVDGVPSGLRNGSVAAVPEPPAWTLFVTGLASCLGFSVLRQKRRVARA